MLRGIVDKNDISGELLKAAEKEIEKEALERFLKASSQETDGKREGKTRTEKMQARRRVMDDRDSMAMERVLGENDLLPIAYLQRGLEVSKAVCRVILRNKIGNPVGSGTGFLIAPDVLLTNHHVIPDPEAAEHSIAEFNYQNDEQFIPCETFHYLPDPKRFFLTDKNLDFTMIALKGGKKGEKSLGDFGHLPLIPDAGKVLEGEYVSIIQHPGGGPKCVTLRENQVRHIFDSFIHYMTDTEPGSSGSPVFNDQWIVVALHHSGVPDPDRKGAWIANEGIRISSIADFVRQQYPAMDKERKKIAETVFPDLKGGEEPVQPEQEEPGALSGRKGYDPLFLGKENRVELPKLSAAMEKDVSRMENGKYLLDYVHFSIVMCRSRGLAYFTAVNIDGKNKVSIDRGDDKWCFDPRIDEEHQYGNEVYARNDLDRGHLVRRKDPNWGEDAHQANADTFHFTNSAPQHKDLNQKIWLGLEDYILKNAYDEKMRVSVFTGPVFGEEDMVYRKKYRIPAEFWKVAVMVREDGQLSATAYLQTQRDMIKGLEFVYGAYETYQLPIRRIEELTGLDFGELSRYDPIADVEFSALRISDEKDIRL